MSRDKEYRIGIGGWTGQGMYLLAGSKREAYNQAIKSYMQHYKSTRSEAKERIKMVNVRVWHNSDGSLPAWRVKAKRGALARRSRRRK